MVDLVKNYSIIARRSKKSVIRELLKFTQQPGVISFAGGLPCPHAFPVEEVKEIANDILSNEQASHKALQYGPTEGLAELKRELIKLAEKDGVKITSDNILITVASQQGLDLVAKVFVDPSDPVLMELPSYLGGIQAFGAYGAKMIGIPIDNDGIRVDLLEKALIHLRDAEEHYKIVYIVPDFQNPSGVTLTTERRKKIIELSKEFDILILEDSPYGEIRFEGEAPPSIYSLDDTNNVIALKTFSKIFVPGLRIGWIIAHPKIIQKLTVAKQSVDLCCPSFTQLIAAEFCKRGYLEKHIEKVKSVYRRKRDIMLEALEEYMPKEEGITWTRPQGGLFLWVELPPYINTEEMFLEAVEQKVAYIIGSAFFCNGKGQNTMRINFSYPTEEEIVEGIKRLANVIKKRVAQKPVLQKEDEFEGVSF